jgi:LytS/YehU family sensor histidine kinase
MMLMDNKTEADIFICNFSDLMRKTLQSSDKISQSLNDELNYIDTFIKLQKIRYDNCFDYTIETDKNLNLQFEVPKHVLFTYVENAIKHGLSVKKKNGLLKIYASIQNNHLTLSIEDNGNGIEKSKTSKPMSTGNGLLIMEKIYSLYTKIHKKKITHELIELFDNENKSIGIKVEIKISL